MNAREEVAYLLWCQIPSEDDAEAKARAGEMLDALVDEVLAADGQAYPGELDMYRILVRTLGVLAGQGDLTAVQQALANHLVDDQAARAGRTVPDLHGIVLKALSTVQGTTHHLGLVTLQLLADRVTDAVTPLVPYREVWDSSLPPGGRVCSICGQPVESEPCPEHAPTFFQPGRTYRHASDGAQFEVVAVSRHPRRGDLNAIGWLTEADGACAIFRRPEGLWDSGEWTDVTGEVTR